MLSRTSLTASTASRPLATASRPLVWASDTTLRSWLRVAIAPSFQIGCAFRFQPEPNKKVPNPVELQGCRPGARERGPIAHHAREDGSRIALAGPSVRGRPGRQISLAGTGLV